MILMLIVNAIIFGQNTLPNDAIQRYKLENSKADLKVFVGEKINVQRSIDTNQNGFYLDQKYILKYKVITNVYGKIKKDTIVFTAFDHYGIPPFTKFKNVLLYVKKVNDQYFHCKYQYNPVFKTKKDKWAGPYSTYDYGRKIKNDSKIKPEIIDFEGDPSIDLSGYPKDKAKRWFFEPYYKIEKDKAMIIYGNYVKDLFELKKNGILKRRGYFK